MSDKINMPHGTIKGYIDTQDASINERITNEVTTLNTRIDGEVKDLNDRIDSEVKELNDTIESEVSTLNTRIDGEVKELNDRITDEVKDLDDKIKNEVNTLNNTINTQVTRLDGRIDETNTNLSNQVTNINNKIETEVNDLENTLNNRIDTEVDTLNNTINEQITNLDDKLDKEVERLDGRIDSTNANIDTKINNVNIRIDTTNDRIDDNRDSINDIIGDINDLNDRLSDSNSSTGNQITNIKKYIDEEIVEVKDFINEEINNVIANGVDQADKLSTGRVLTVGNTGKIFDGTHDVSWSLEEIGALPTSGGTMNGGLTLNTNNGTTPLEINRNGNEKESTKIYQTDNGMVMDVENDESNTNITINMKATDTENSDGSNSKSGSVVISVDSNGSKVTANTFVGNLTGNVSGNTTTANRLANARKINGTAFDGASDITTNIWGTARTITIGNSTKTVNGSNNVGWTLSEIGALPANGGNMTGQIVLEDAGFTTKTSTSQGTFQAGSDCIYISNDTTDGGTLKLDDNGHIYYDEHELYHEGHRPTPDEIGASPVGHTHKYAGSSSVGGVANSAAKLEYIYKINETNFNGTADITTTTWGTARNISIASSDGTGAGTATSVNGSQAYTLKLPSTIKASLSGNADTATKLQTGRNINGTSFNGTTAITTSNWGTARNISIASSDGTGAGTATSVNGSQAYTLKLPGTIKASLSGNASSASKLQTARTITLSGDVSGSTSFDGSGNVSITTTVADDSHGHNSINTKGTNTINSKANDTTSNWGAQGNSVHWYTTAGLLNDQPSQWGYILNLGSGSEVHQIWATQSSGNLAHRGGNASGWSGSWRTIIDSSNLSSYVPLFIRTSVGDGGWTVADNNAAVTVSGLAYWNGAYKDTSSNLAYCNHGAFGSIVTKNSGDYATASHGHTTPRSGAWWNGYVFVAGDGVTEVGKHLDFHNASNDSADFNVRLTSNGSNLEASGGIKATNNLYAGPKLTMGSGGSDIYIHNSTSGKYLQLQDNGTLAYSGTPVSLQGHTHDYAPSNHTHNYAASGHTHSYLPLSGGNLTGNLSIAGKQVVVFDSGTPVHSKIRGGSGLGGANGYITFSW